MSIDNGRPCIHPFTRIVLGLNVPEKACGLISVVITDSSNSVASSFPVCSINSTKQSLSASILNNRPLHLCPGAYDSSQLKQSPLVVCSRRSSTVSILRTIGSPFVPVGGVLIKGPYVVFEDTPSIFNPRCSSKTFANENAFRSVSGSRIFSSPFNSGFNPPIKKLIRAASDYPETPFSNSSNCSR